MENRRYDLFVQSTHTVTITGERWRPVVATLAVLCSRGRTLAWFLCATRDGFLSCLPSSYTMEQVLDLNHPAIDEEFSPVHIACIVAGEE